jgi:protein transport protein SEC24
MPPTYFFVIDVSYYSVSSGMLHTLAETVKKTLDKLPDTERTNVGFITFDSSIHFYNLKVRRHHTCSFSSWSTRLMPHCFLQSSLSQPRMLVVTDVEDVFLPLPDDMLVNLKDSRAVVDTLLGIVPPHHTPTPLAGW